MALRNLYRARSNDRLLAKAAAFLLDHSQESEVLVLAPTRAAANEFAISAAPDGIQGVHALTLVQLAASLAAQSMGLRGLAPISRLGIEAIAARIVHAARQADKLRYFAPVAQTPGFPRAAAKTIAEIRLQGVQADQIASAGAAGVDLAHLMNLYEQELEQRSLADLPMMLDFAAAAASAGAHRFSALPLIFLDLRIESERHRKLLASLVAKSPAVLAATIAGDDRSIQALETLLDSKAQDLDAPPVAALDRIRHWLFSSETPPAAPPENDLLFSAPGESLECIEIARRIRAFAAAGTPFDRMAVLLRNVEQYQPLVEEALRRAAIPEYFGRGAARPDPAGRAFLALLACASDGCSASRFAEYLSLGQLPPLDENGAPAKQLPLWVAPDDEILGNFSASPVAVAAPEIAGDESTLAVPIGWEKLLVDAAVIGGHHRWARRLRGLRAELRTQLRALDKEDQSHRVHLQRRIEQLRGLEHYALPLIDTLGALPQSANWAEWLDRLAALAQMSLRHPESVLAVLAELEPMGEVGPVQLDEIYDVLSQKLCQLRSEPPQRRYGHVFVASVDEARGRTFDIVFLPGLAEGLFPRRALEDPLLLDALRQKIPEASLDTQDDRVARERMLLRSAAAAASRKLVVSYPRMDLSQSRPRVPSFYALEVLRAAEGRLPSLREFEKRAAANAPSRLDWPAPSDPNVAIDDAEYDLASLQAALKLPRAKAQGSARYLMETNSSLARSLRTRGRRWRNRWTAADGIVDPDIPTLKMLEAHQLSQRSYSPSSLQHFAACPYRFLLQGIFRFRPREAAVPLEQMDPLTRGALFHAVQFELFRKLQKLELLPIVREGLSGAFDIADQVLDRIASKYEDDLAPAIPRVWKSEVEDLRTDLRGWLQQVASGPPDWLPIHFEFGFGLPLDEHRDPESVKEEAVIANGIRLRGSIDLVERHATRNVLRVTDHKTGKAPLNRPQHVGGGAILQPLLYALAAEQVLNQTVEAGSLFFCTQRGDFSQIDIALDPAARTRLGQVLETIDGFIAQGFFPAAPQAGACGFCDYRPVCGPYEEQRSRRKEPGRLEALVNLRNLP